MVHKRYDPDIKDLSLSALRKEVMRLRNGIRRWRDTYNNEECHEEDDRLVLLLPEQTRVHPITFSREDFERNCRRFSARKARLGQFQPNPVCVKKHATTALRRSHGKSDTRV